MSRRVRSLCRLEEGATMFMLVGLNAAILFFTDFGKAASVFFLNLTFIAVILIISRLHGRWNNRAFTFLRDWYPLPLLITIYLELGRLVPLVNPHDADGLLIEIDRGMFLGHDPTVLLENITVPLVTEFLQIVYASFYLLPFALSILVYWKGRRETFHTVASAIIIGFYVSYVGYFLTPAIGPRYTLDHLQNLQLTGLVSFDFIRWILDSASGIMRDCCPSGHTMLSLVTVFLAWRYERKFTSIALAWSIVLIFSAVYLRYHYVIDVIIGIVLALAFTLAFPAIEKYSDGISASYGISFSKMR